MRRTPVAFSIDVEPHGFQLADDRARGTTGCDETVALVERVRPALHEATGNQPSFGWYFRMDPQIATTFGDAQHLVSALDGRVDQLRAAGDHFGVHTHLLRWSQRHGEWVHDVADREWTRECIESALSAFEDAFGAPCRRHRAGAALCTQEIADSLERGGVVVECGLEPLPAPKNPRPVTTLDSTDVVGQRPDCSRAPRQPYHPMAGDFVRSGPPGGLTILPITTTRLSPARPGWQTWGWWSVARRRRPPVRGMYPWLDLPATQYWDWLGRHLRTMRRPHANIAVRTDHPDSAAFQQTKALLEALPEHPIASRIELVDPVAMVAELSGARGSRAPARSQPS